MNVRTESLRLMNTTEYYMISKAFDVACELWKSSRKFSNTWVYAGTEDIVENGESVRNAFEVALCREDIDKPADRYSVNDIESLVVLLEKQLDFLGLDKEFSPFYLD